MIRRTLSFITGAVMGALVGATVAILMAPASGEDLRTQMRDRIDRLRDELGDAASQRRAELEKQLARLRQPQREVTLEKAEE
jgi:gas vesicle protein